MHIYTQLLHAYIHTYMLIYTQLNTLSQEMTAGISKLTKEIAVSTFTNIFTHFFHVMAAGISKLMHISLYIFFMFK